MKLNNGKESESMEIFFFKSKSDEFITKESQ